MQSLHKEYMLNPPNEVHLTLNTPKEVSSLKQLSKYMWKHFHIEIDTDPDSDEYEYLFYNADLRSFMGFVQGDDLVIFPQYFVGEEKPTDAYSPEWRALLRQSDILGEDFELKEHGLGLPLGIKTKRLWKVIGVTPNGDEYLLTYTSSKTACRKYYTEGGWKPSQLHFIKIQPRR